MAQANLKSDSFCQYNQSAAPVEWVLQKAPEQGFANTYSIGSVGIFPAENAVRPDVINIDSYLSGRDSILSKCNPPVPALDEAEETPLTYQNQEMTNNLQPIYSREKRSAINLDSITYIPLTFSPELFNPAQDLNHIIFNGQAQRGGLDTSNLIKSTWNSDACEYFLDPQRACGKDCSEANGYMTRLPFSKQEPEAKWGKLPKGLPSNQWFAPGSTGTQIGRAAGPTVVTSQLVVSAGADNSGPQQVVPTQRASPNDPRNKFMSFNKLPQRNNPYNPPPRMANPVTGAYYYSNTFSPLVAQ